MLENFKALYDMREVMKFRVEEKKNKHGYRMDLTKSRLVKNNLFFNVTKVMKLENF